MVQGITGREGQFHTRQCIAYGSRVVAGVTPGKAGQRMDDVPVFNTVKDAVKETGADCSLIFVPPPFAADAIMEAVDAGVDAGGGHHRGDPGAGHDAGQSGHGRQTDTAHRAQLPGDHHAGPVQGGHHARAHPPGRTAPSGWCPGRAPSPTKWCTS